MNATGSLNHKDLAELALARADTYDLLVAIFGRLPDAELVTAIKGQAIINTLDNSPGVAASGFREGVTYIKSYLSSRQGQAVTDILNELSVDRTRLIRATGRRDLKAPYEGLYCHRTSAGAAVLAVRNCYRAAGLLPDEDNPEPPDFLGVELDFMSCLCHREHGRRISAGDVTEIVAAQEQFLREHLGSWVGEFCERAENIALTDFYRGFLIVLSAFVYEDRGYLGQLVRAP